MTRPASQRLGRTLRRRLVTVPAVLVAAAVLLPLLVALVPALALVDLVRRDLRFPLPRLALFGVWYLVWELVAVVAAIVLFPLTLGGIERGWSLRVHSGLQAVWVGALLGAGRRLLGLDLRIDGAECLGDGPLVVLSRHASMVDTLVPAKLLLDRGLRVRYVMKDELLLDPALDIIGGRLPNYFVDRSSEDHAAELAGIRSLAARAAPDDAVIIFPEGTRWSPHKRERALERLRASNPTAARRAEGRTCTMPPRPGGTLALLDGLPDADVVVIRHTGLEGLAGPKDAFRLLPLRHPIQVSIRRVPRHRIPVDTDGRTAWLNDEWDEVDAWIRDHRTG